MTCVIVLHKGVDGGWLRRKFGYLVHNMVVVAIQLVDVQPTDALLVIKDGRNTLGPKELDQTKLFVVFLVSC